MTGKLTESAIENFAIGQFEVLGYRYIYGSDIAPDLLGLNPEKCYCFSGFLSDMLI